MILLANLLRAVAGILDIIFTFMVFMLIARAILSWVNADPSNGIVRFLVGTTDPLMSPLRQKMPFLIQRGVDFTPLFALFVIYFFKFFLVGTLNQYAYSIAQSAGVAGAW